jgi:hypothetical protein
VEPLSGTPTATPEEQFQAISLLLDQGVDPSVVDSPQQEEGPTRPGALVPGDGSQDPTLKLTDTEQTQLAEYLCELCDRNDGVMDGRRETEQDIQLAYKMAADPQQQGRGPAPSEMVSEFTMSLTDQASARITANIMGVDPIAKVTPIDGADQESLVSIETAAATERFLQEYTLREMNLRTKLPLAIHRVCKVGTCVLKAEWKTRKKMVWKLQQDLLSGRETYARIPQVEGKVNVQLVPNRHMIVWPPTIADWQEEYEIVGQEEFYSKSRWHALAASLGLDKETVDRVDAQPGGESDFLGEEVLAESGVEVTSMRESMPMTKLTELWCDTVIPGRTEPEKFQVILHRDTRQILWADYNRYQSQKHPYFPIRYKLVDELAWGDGVGHEVRMHQACDSALRNLELDSLKAGAYWVILRRSGWVHETLTDRVMPGQVIPVDDVEADFKPIKLGGEVPELISAKQDNSYRAREASGQSAVLSGMGDPIQKSGAGTGSTVALIEQAGKKFGQVDATIRNDLSAFYQFTLELIAQMAPEGVYYRCANEEDARVLMSLRWTPPRGDVGSLYHIWAQAPSAANSQEARKQALVMASQYLEQHLSQWLPMAQQILSQENPAAIDRLNREVLDFRRKLTYRVIEDYDIPGIKDQIPEIPEPIPEDQVINQLMQQLQQMQQQYEQLQMQFQQHLATMPQQPMEAAPVQ